MKRVLVIDDEPVIRALIAASLEGSDCEVATAADGSSAIESLAQTRPDLILLDVGLPGMNGPEVLRHLPILALAEDSSRWTSGHRAVSKGEEC